MALTKTYVSSVTPGTSNAAATSTPGTVVPIATAYAAHALISIANGASAPTASCVGTVIGSADGTNFYTIGFLSGGIVASTTTTTIIEIPSSLQSVQVNFTGNLTNAVTVGAQIATITAL